MQPLTFFIRRSLKSEVALNQDSVVSFLASLSTTAPRPTMSSMNGGGGPRAKCDQVIFEAITKAAEIIAHARSPSPYMQSVSNRFNLQVPEIAEIRKSLTHFRQSLHLPLRIDIYSQSQLVERWSLAYVQQPQQQSQLYGDSIVQLRHVCKKVVIWLRTLYVMTRMLPAFAVRGANVQYRLEQGSNPLEVPAFNLSSSPSVPTPYGFLHYKVWYAPHVQKPTTAPIPIMQMSGNATNITSPATPVMAAKSAPNREMYPPSAGGQARSLDRRLLLKKTQSNMEDHSESYDDRPRLHERSNSGQMISHRAALHDPPTYAYNAAPTTNRPDVPVLSSSPVLGSTPTNTPAFLSSTPPTLGFLLPPPSSRNATTPPFSGLPRELSKEVLPQLADSKDEGAPISSLDLLHSSPFKVSAFSSMGESMLLRNSTAAVASSYLQPAPEEEDDMPFAVDVEEQIGSHRLVLLENNNNDFENMSALSKQLQDFKAFGASLG